MASSEPNVHNELASIPNNESHQHNPNATRSVVKNRKVGRWFIADTLGKGAYSWVKKGYDCKDGRIVALKFISKSTDHQHTSKSKQIQKELNALLNIKNKYILQILCYNLNAKYPQKDGSIISSVLLVSEYVSGGELFDILYYRSAITETITRTYFMQLISAIETLHDAGICHGNIKPQNLLLDANFQLKVADFGLTEAFKKDDTLVGTRGYSAPEQLQQKQYTTACDVFSCGVVLFILLSGYPPFEAATPKCRWYSPLRNGNAREFWKQHRGCGIPGVAKDLITRMLWYDYNKRISITGLKKHKWYNEKVLHTKELASELRRLQRLMEIKRREDAGNKKQLQDSIKRSLDIHIPMYADEYTLGLSVGGAKDINTFRKNIENNILPKNEHVITSQGLFYDYFFEMCNNNMCNNENDMFYPIYSCAKTKDTAFMDGNNGYSTWMTVGLDSNIKEEGFKRNKLNLVIVCDKSGSMSASFDKDEQQTKSKMLIAQESIISLLTRLNDDDRFGFISFNQRSKVHYGLQSMKDISMDHLKDDILNIVASGGTNFEESITTAIQLYQQLEYEGKDGEYENRIIYLTDAKPTIGSNDAETLISLTQNYSEGDEANPLQIYTTFIGIGLDFNAALIEKINNFRGCNYYSVYSQKQFNEQMDDEFDYMVTPLFFNISLTFTSDTFQIEHIYGINQDDAKDSVGTICNDCTEGRIVNIKTLFPSKKDQSTKEVKGGIILLKLKQLGNGNNIKAKLCVTYEDKKGKIYHNEQTVSCDFGHKTDVHHYPTPKDMIAKDDHNNIEQYPTPISSVSDIKSNNDYYDNNGIRKGILLSQYYTLIKHWLNDEWDINNHRYDLIIGISDKYQQKFKVFHQHFCEEMKCLNDDTLNRELIIIEKVSNLETNELREDIAKQRREKEQVFVETYLSKQEENDKCIAPQLPPNETITLTDVHTYYKPKKVLAFIQNRVIEQLAGTTNVDYQNVSMEIHLATHNFPAPVTIQVQIFEQIEYECYLVKFTRVTGDTLQFGRDLRQLIKSCGHVLTGLPRRYCKVTENEREQSELCFGDKI